ncbi:hypothetical protein ADK67_18095 [Saccharothrix sp. NRRL B-16348]|nr:hypothetical protein ADK67_18095 [Saccharothrix sp. NRRL B-16348]
MKPLHLALVVGALLTMTAASCGQQQDASPASPTARPPFDTMPAPLPPSRTPPGTTPVLPEPTHPELTLPVVRDGHVAYRKPGSMRVNDLQRVAVRVSGEIVPPGFTSGLPGNGGVTTGPAKVGDLLTSSLTGPDFDISLVGDKVERRLLRGDHVEWAWDVRPKRSGKLFLDFSLYVVVPGEDAPIYHKTYDHSVEVEVNFIHSVGAWAKDYGALTGLSIPVLAAAAWKLAAWLRKRRKDATPEGPGEHAPSTH